MSFGGDEKSTQQVNTVNLRPEQQKFIDAAMGALGGFGSNPLTLLQGSQIADFNPLELLAQQFATSQAQGSLTDLAQGAAGAQSAFFAPGFTDPTQNPVIGNMADAITGRVNENLMENILPGISRGFAVSGGPFSGGQTREAVVSANAIGDTNEGLSRELSNLFLGSQQFATNAQQQALAMNPNIMQQQLMPASVMGQVGGQQRMMDQLRLDEGAQRHLFSQMEPFLRAQQLLGLVGMIPTAGGQSTVTGSTPGGGGFGGALGGAATGATLGSFFGPMGSLIGGGLGGLGGFFL